MSATTTIQYARAHAVARAAEAMLRALGGGPVTLRVPAMLDVGDTGLGLAVPVLEDVELTPAVVRTLAADAQTGRGRHEITFSAKSVLEQADLRAAESAEALFDAALGVVLRDRLMRIERVEAESLGDVEYLYRVIVAE